MNQKGGINLSVKEIRRLRVLHRIETGTLKLKEAAAMLGLCTKQMGRIWKRYQSESEFGLAHRSRGMPGNRRKDAALRSRAVELYREKYHDFGPTLAAEKMKERDGLEVNRETLRRWLWGACLWKGKTTHSLHRKRRRRKEHFGEMVQMDGSDHTWFEERGERCCLMVMVDDATGHTEAHFCGSETTRDALLLLLKWIKKHGVPSKLYTDRKNIYVTDRLPTEEEKRQGTGALTEFGQVCARLGIQIIPAGSPQAKGRIERKNGVLQDRLVKELRLMGINGIEDANRGIDSFLEDLNRRFRVAPTHEANYHRELPLGESLEHLFRIEKKRRLQNVEDPH